jgi:phage gp29-like protein
MLEPRLLTSFLDAFRLGFFRNIALAWDVLERRDYKIQAVASKRKKAVARYGWEILTLDDSPAAQQQKLALEYFYNHVTATNVLDENETGGFALLVRQMMDAVGKRYAVHEIVWKPVASANSERGTGNPQLTATFRFCPLWWFEGTQGRLRFLTSEFAIYGVEMEPGGWLVTVGDGIMEASSVAWVYKSLPLRDWIAYTEKFGTPGIVGKTDASLNSKEWEDFSEIIKNFSQNWSAIVSKGNEVELIQPKGASETPFATVIEKMDRAITTLWRGADLGTMSSHNAAGASLQADETNLLEVDDAQMISETLTAQVSRHVLQYHFGDVPQLAYIKIRTPDRKEVAQSLQVDQFLLQSGAPVAVKDALERYDRPIPDAGEVLLKAGAPTQVAHEAK